MYKVKYNRKEYREEFLRSEEWRSFRDTIFKTNPPCQCCGEKATDLHHMVYRNIVDIRVGDVLPVCRKCHNYIHQAIKDEYISQNPKELADIKKKTLNILNDNEYKGIVRFLKSKHKLLRGEIEKMKNLHPNIIKKISKIVNNNMWYNDLQDTEFTGRQIVAIKKLIKNYEHGTKKCKNFRKPKGYFRPKRLDKIGANSP